MEKISTSKASEGLNLPEASTEEKREGLRLLFRNKYVQTETAFWSKGLIAPGSSCPEG